MEVTALPRGETVKFVTWARAWPRRGAAGVKVGARAPRPAPAARRDARSLPARPPVRSAPGPRRAAVSDGAAAMTTPAVGAAPGRPAARRPGAAPERGVRASPRPVPRPRRGGRAVRQLPVRQSLRRPRSAGRAGRQTLPRLRRGRHGTSGGSSGSAAAGPRCGTFYRLCVPDWRLGLVSKYICTYV